MPVVDRADLSAYLQRPVDERTADIAVRMAEGQVRPLVRSTSWPPNVTEHPDLWSAVLELAAMAVDNPTSMGSSVVGGQTESWVVARRGEILAEVANRHGTATSPAGSFPPAVPWPDPVDRARPARW